MLLDSILKFGMVGFGAIFAIVHIFVLMYLIVSAIISEWNAGKQCIGLAIIIMILTFPYYTIFNPKIAIISFCLSLIELLVCLILIAIEKKVTREQLLMKEKEVIENGLKVKRRKDYVNAIQEIQSAIDKLGLKLSNTTIAFLEESYKRTTSNKEIDCEQLADTVISVSNVMRSYQELKKVDPQMAEVSEFQLKQIIDDLEEKVDEITHERKVKEERAAIKRKEACLNDFERSCNNHFEHQLAQLERSGG